VFSWSYNALSAEAAAVFGALGLAPGVDIGLPAAASLTALPMARVLACLRELEQAHLVDQHAPGRYRMHDLVRLYAGERAQQDTAALRRVADFYLHSAFAAECVLDPPGEPIVLGPPATGCVPREFGDGAAASEWLTTELPNLLAVQKLAAEQGWHDKIWHLAWGLDTYLRRRGNYHDLVAVWRAGLAAVEHSADRRVRTLVRKRLGVACGGLGLHTEAFQHLRVVLAACEEMGDVMGQANAHHVLAGFGEELDDDRLALDHAVPALRLFQDLGLPVYEAWSHTQVGWHQARLGFYEQARVHCETALTMARQNDDRELEATTVDSLGYIDHHTGHHAEALDRYQQALGLIREIGYDYHEADTLKRLGHTQRALGQHDLARATWQRALELYRAQHRAEDAARIREHLDGYSTSSASESCNRPETPSLR
jgi:tetratricopeptide (TPR) repeat protein